MTKIVMLELTPEIMMACLEMMAEMLVCVKRNPALTSLIPGDPARLLVNVLEQTVEHFNRKQGESVTEEEEFANAKKRMDELLERVSKGAQ